MVKYDGVGLGWAAHWAFRAGHLQTSGLTEGAWDGFNESGDKLQLQINLRGSGVGGQKAACEVFSVMVPEGSSPPLV